LFGRAETIGIRLELNSIGFIYQTPEREKEALKDLSFQIEDGEFVSLVGPSGCGKSTVLSIIAGLLKPTSGEVLLSGQRINGTTPEVGYMPQKDQLFGWRNIWLNVTLGLEIRKKDASYYEKAEKLMEKYGLSDVMQMTPGKLSGGMRQRCALIRTLVTDPEFLLLDEPFPRWIFRPECLYPLTHGRSSSRSIRPRCWSPMTFRKA